MHFGEVDATYAKVREVVGDISKIEGHSGLFGKVKLPFSIAHLSKVLLF
jgi:hypothetical protein